MGDAPDNKDQRLINALERIADALESSASQSSPLAIDKDYDAFIWHTDPDRLSPVANVNRVGLRVGFKSAF